MLELEPRFVQVPILRNGWLLISCYDTATAEWLEKHEFWPKTGCRVVKECDFPAANVISIYPKFSKELDLVTVLGLIAGQNNIDVKGWNFLSR